AEKFQSLQVGTSVIDQGESGIKSELLRKLHEACRSSDLETVRGCLMQGAPVDGRDEHGWAALHYSAAAGSVEVCQLLLSFHADANAVLPDLSTPLMLAAEEAHLPVAKLLLASGALSKCKDEDGFTAAVRCDGSVQAEFKQLVSS
ncbi:unnamed protein product, partial [Polarella glacialis]